MNCPIVCAFIWKSKELPWRVLLTDESKKVQQRKCSKLLAWAMMTFGFKSAVTCYFEVSTSKNRFNRQHSKYEDGAVISGEIRGSSDFIFAYLTMKGKPSPLELAVETWDAVASIGISLSSLSDCIDVRCINFQFLILPAVGIVKSIKVDFAFCISQPISFAYFIKNFFGQPIKVSEKGRRVAGTSNISR